MNIRGWQSIASLDNIISSSRVLPFAGVDWLSATRFFPYILITQVTHAINHNGIILVLTNYHIITEIWLGNYDKLSTNHANPFPILALFYTIYCIAILPGNPTITWRLTRGRTNFQALLGVKIRSTWAISYDFVVYAW